MKINRSYKFLVFLILILVGGICYQNTKYKWLEDEFRSSTVEVTCICKLYDSDSNDINKKKLERSLKKLIRLYAENPQTKYTKEVCTGLSVAHSALKYSEQQVDLEKLLRALEKLEVNPFDETGGAYAYFWEFANENSG